MFLFVPAQQVKPRATAALALTASAGCSKFDDLAPTSLPKGTLPHAPYFVKLRRTRPPGLGERRSLGDVAEAYPRYEEELDAVFLEEDNQLSSNFGKCGEDAELKNIYPNFLKFMLKFAQPINWSSAPQF
jgi:hypothetical protein